MPVALRPGMQDPSSKIRRNPISVVVIKLETDVAAEDETERFERLADEALVDTELPDTVPGIPCPAESFVLRKPAPSSDRS